MKAIAHAVLTHPLAQVVKAPLRNAWWRVKGRDAGNPPMPDRVESILFVCLGNICRSPFGALLASRILSEDGRARIRCSSAGLRPSQDDRSPEEACHVSDAYGVALTDHRPAALTRELMRTHDVVIVMEWKQLRELRGAYPELRERIFLLPLFDNLARNAYERFNIADPFGRGLEAFEDCYRRVDRSLRRCLALLPR